MAGAALDGTPSAQSSPAPPQPTVLWRVTDRASFDALRRRGRRAVSGPVRCSWLPPAPGAPPTPPRAAFTVGRRAGGAVVRNRIRRRLRSALRQLAAEGRLPAGTYLLGGDAALATLPWPELRDQVESAVDASTRSARC